MYVPYSTFKLLNPCPYHTVEGPYCAKPSLQVGKLATKQELFDLYLMAIGLGRVAEHANMLQRYFINVAEFLQICHIAMSFCFVILVWTQS
jgi:hypothetical protein